MKLSIIVIFIIALSLLHNLRVNPHHRQLRLPPHHHNRHRIMIAEMATFLMNTLLSLTPEPNRPSYMPSNLSVHAVAMNIQPHQHHHHQHHHWQGSRHKHRQSVPLH